MRSYPVPQPLVASVGAQSMRLPLVRAIAHAPDSTPAEREWAWKILDSERDALALALTACGCSDDDEHYGILDPDSDETLIIAVVALGDGGDMRRWNGSGWDTVPDELEPVGYPFVALDDDDLLADALGAVGAGGSLLLRPTDAKTRVRGGMTAAGESEGVYAVVDDFDSTAVLDVFAVTPEGIRRRSDGDWVQDAGLVGRLRSVDPPHVVAVPEDQVDRVVAAVDEYDDAHQHAVTAAIPWDEALHPRISGKFAPKGTASQSGGQAPPPGGDAAATAEYIRTGKGRPSWVPAPKSKKKKGRKARVHKPRRARTARAVAEPSELSQLQDKWQAEDAKFADADAKYDIARSKSDLAETKRRDTEDQAVKDEYDRLNRELANDPAALNSEIAKLNDRVRKETKRRDAYDRSAKYEAAAEKIRRAERRRAISAQRAIERARAKRRDAAKRLARQRAAQHPRPVKAAANPPAHTRMPNNLEDYWARGKGAAKIRWGTHGDFNRCRRHLAKYLRPDQVPGACANLHKIATGEWPGKNAHGGRAKRGVHASGYTGNGSMISMPVDPTVAQKLEVPDGMDPADMHITLAYLGNDVDPEILEVAREIAQAVALEYNQMPCTLSGTGEFLTGEDAPVQYASVDAPGLETMRVDLCDRLSRAGVPLPSEHGFTPHVTLKYGSFSDESERPALPVDTSLGRIEVCTGPDRQGWDLLP